MKDYTVTVKAETVYRRKLFKKIVKITFLFLLILISLIYLFLYVLNDGGNFTIRVDRDLSNKKNIYLSEDGSG